MKKIMFLFLFSFCFMQSIGNFNLQYSTRNSGAVGVNWDNQTKMLFYQAERKDPATALIYQMFSPPFWNVGYAYADNWSRGAYLDIFSVGSFITGMMLVNSGSSCSEEYDYYYDEYTLDCDGSGGEGPGAFLLIGSAVIQIFKIVDVYQITEKYNDNLYNRLFNDNRPRFSLNYSKDNRGVDLALSLPF